MKQNKEKKEAPVRKIRPSTLYDSAFSFID